MNDRVLVSDLIQHLDERVKVEGRVIGVRTLGGVGFINLLDRSGVVQVVLGTEHQPPPLHSVIAVEGGVRAEERAQGGVELHAQGISLHSTPRFDLPFNPVSLPKPGSEKGPALETLLDHRVLSLRGPAHRAILQANASVLEAIDSFFRGSGFVEVKTPKIVGGGTEGGANVFEVRYFERAAFLAQSPQLYKEALAATPLERVFEIGPAFRAEKHATGRHLNEFVSIDAEIAFPEGMEEVMGVAEGLVAEVVGALEAGKDYLVPLLGAFELPMIPSGSVPRLSLKEAKEIALGKPASRLHPPEDLTPEEERAICSWAREAHGSDAVFVHSFPLRAKPFYTKPRGRHSSFSFDLLLRGLEISSGGLRIQDSEEMEAALDRHGVGEEGLEAYTEMIRSGCPPHGGFGMGLERLVQRLLNLPNVRYASAFPRDRNRVSP